MRLGLDLTNLINNFADDKTLNFFCNENDCN